MRRKFRLVVPDKGEDAEKVRNLANEIGATISQKTYLRNGERVRYVEGRYICERKVLKTLRKHNVSTLVCFVYDSSNRARMLLQGGQPSLVEFCHPSETHSPLAPEPPSVYQPRWYDAVSNRIASLASLF